MSKVQVLIATMHQADYSLLDKMNIRSDAVVVNQCNRNDRQTFLHNGRTILWIDSTQRGLSKSRNMAISAATADICLISDDDMIYRDDYVSSVSSAFQEYPDADIIRFEVAGIEKPFKQYDHIAKKLGYLSSMKSSSVELAFKRSAVVDNQIIFDERIGAGTEFLMGEENAFLFSCLRHRLSIRYEPTVMADLHIGNSSWFSGYNEQYFIGKGASFAAMSPRFSRLLIVQFLVRKNKLYRASVSPIQALKYMLSGRKLYLLRRQTHDT